MMRLALRFLIVLFLTVAGANAQQLVIGVGTTANDGSGDPVRTAFQKANTNFTAVFLNILTVSNTVTVNTGNITTVSNSVGTVAANLTIVSNSLTTVSNSLTGKINAQTGTTYSFLAADASKLTTFTNAAAVAVTLAVFPDGTVFHVKNLGVGVVTITSTPATIDFAATLILTKGQSASIFSDGANYRTTLAHGNLSTELFANVLNVANPTSLATAQRIDLYQSTDSIQTPTNYARMQILPNQIDFDEVGTGTLGTQLKISYNNTTRHLFDVGNGHVMIGNGGIYRWASAFSPTLTGADTGVKRKIAGVVTVTTSSTDDTGQFSSINGLSIGSIFTQTADATVANTTTETSILGTGSGTKTVAAGAINTVGRTLRIQVRGMISVNVGSPTLTVRFKIQGVTISTGVIAVNAASSNAFSIDELVTTRSTGASGTVASNGEFSYQDTLNGSPSVGLLQPGTSTTDLTTSKTLDITVQWSAANALNTITSQVATIEILN